jgi:hypothetical protein
MPPGMVHTVGESGVSAGSRLPDVLDLLMAEGSDAEEGPPISFSASQRCVLAMHGSEGNG